jgi:ribonucleoside-diphosphate reductase alpha chain
VKAKDIFKKILKTIVETGMPYVFFRDTVNEVNPNKHA